MSLSDRFATVNFWQHLPSGSEPEREGAGVEVPDFDFIECGVAGVLELSLPEDRARFGQLPVISSVWW